MRRLAIAFACAPVLALAAPASDKDSDSALSVKAGYDFTAGRYGQRGDTTLSTVSASVSYDTDDYSFDVMLPYLREKGPGRVIFLPGRRPLVIIGPDRKASGPGDITVGATRYVLDEDTQGLDLDVGAIVKVGSASAKKGLGTGKQDLSVQSALGKAFGGLEATLTAGYTLVGKAPGLELKNSFYGSLDASFRIAAPLRVGATYSAGQTSAVGASGSRDGTAYVEFKPAKGLKVELYYLKGWSTQSPDRGGGLTVSCSL